MMCKSFFSHCIKIIIKKYLSEPDKTKEKVKDYMDSPSQKKHIKQKTELIQSMIKDDINVMAMIVLTSFLIVVGIYFAFPILLCNCNKSRVS